MPLEILANTSIGIYKNFLSIEERRYLVDMAKQQADVELNFYNELDPNYSFWDKKNIEFGTIPGLDMSLIFEIQKRVESVFLAEYLQDPRSQHRFVQMNNIHRFLEGDGMSEHSDRGPSTHGNGDISHGFVLYLNDEYSGGEIYYPNLNIEIKSLAGSLVVHPSDVLHTHGVRKVSRGSRYTMTMFAKDPA
jgi:hypothetical protein